jgi:hypothetical protein
MPSATSVLLGALDCNLKDCCGYFGKWSRMDIC